jgi:hypothetical protein
VKVTLPRLSEAPHWVSQVIDYTHVPGLRCLRRMVRQRARTETPSRALSWQPGLLSAWRLIPANPKVGMRVIRANCILSRRRRLEVGTGRDSLSAAGGLGGFGSLVALCQNYPPHVGSSQAPSTQCIPLICGDFRGFGGTG